MVLITKPIPLPSNSDLNEVGNIPPITAIYVLSPAPPPAPTPPSQIPVRNLIVEEPLQRGEELPNPRPTRASTLGTPSDANPFAELPQEYRPNLNSYYSYHKPLDTFRYHSDKYWNMLQYDGGYNSVGEALYLPIRSVTVDNDLTTPEYDLPVWEVGNVIPSPPLYNMPDTNFMQHHLVEKVRISANPAIFTAYADPVPEIPTYPGVDARGYVDEVKRKADVLTEGMAEQENPPPPSTTAGQPGGESGRVTAATVRNSVTTTEQAKEQLGPGSLAPTGTETTAGGSDMGSGLSTDRLGGISGNYGGDGN